MPSTPTQLQRPPSPRKDKATVPLLDLLTGHNYAPASASHPSSSTRTIPCPYPDILDLVEEERAGDVQHPPCGYWFGRIYDLERHLKGTHGLVVERDELEEYMESKGVAIV
jgi:general transcription factor IIIA